MKRPGQHQRDAACCLLQEVADLLTDGVPLDKFVADLCVQQRLARSAGDRPAGVRARAP